MKFKHNDTPLGGNGNKMHDVSNIKIKYPANVNPDAYASTSLFVTQESVIFNHKCVLLRMLYSIFYSFHFF